MNDIEDLFKNYMLVTDNFSEAAATLTLAHVIAAIAFPEEEVPKPVAVNVTVTSKVSE